MRAIIFCNGDIDDYSGLKERCADSLVICADGGIRHAERIGIMPDVIIGDNDSRQSAYEGAKEIFVYPTRKDYTDTQLCVDCAIERGCNKIELLGGMGGRHDHEYSHYCLMEYALNRGSELIMLNECNMIFMKDKPFTLQKCGYKYVSFFPFGGRVDGFSVEGLEYTAENMTLECGLVQATSNEFAGADEAMISFKSGKLLVMLCNDKK